MPGLSQRTEDIEPNLDYELDRFAEQNNTLVTFNKEARKKFVTFACSPQATWIGNFRDLNGAVKRMATLAQGGRITLDVVKEELERLRHLWHQPENYKNNDLLTKILGQEKTSGLDLFDKASLEATLQVCVSSANMSEAGRRLFAVSRENKKQPNDADRLRKYLTKFGLSWKEIKA